MHTSQSQLKALQAEMHPFCFVCSQSNPHGLALEFEEAPDGVLTAAFHANPALEGYPGLLHGGITACLLDGAMTNCLFAQGIVAVTAELKIRYSTPVQIGSEIRLRAWIEERHPPLYFVRAKLTQEHWVRAAASAKFVERHE